MVELRSTAPDVFARSYAGDVYNTAVYLKRSLPAARVGLLTCTGDDLMSGAMRAAWKREGLDDAAAFTQRGRCRPAQTSRLPRQRTARRHLGACPFS